MQYPISYFNTLLPLGIFDTNTQTANISSNSMDGYQTGIQLDGNHPGTYLTCNEFENGNTAVKFSADWGGTVVKNWDFEDPNNKFVNAALDLDNQSSFAFQIEISPLSTFPPSTFNGSILPSTSLVLKNCGSKSRSVADDVAPELTIYPNPNNGQFNIAGLNPEHSGLITVIDIAGKLIYHTQYSGVAQMELDLQNVSPGVYTLSISDGITNTVERILIK
jgi:hypothetical protein